MKAEKIIGIYSITNPEGQVYIGQSVNIKRRWVSHKACKDAGRLKDSFLKYGFANHIFLEIERCEQFELNERERYYQDKFDVLGPNGLNITLTKTKDKLAFTPDWIKATQSKANVGKIVSVEARNKHSINHKGKIMSPESRQLMSINSSGAANPKSKQIIDTATGSVFDSIKLAAESIKMKPVSLSDRLIGKVKNNTNFIYYIDNGSISVNKNI